MTRALPLVRHSLRRARGLIAGIGCLAGGFQLLAAILASTVQESNMFGPIAGLAPPFVREVFGPSMLAVLSFRGLVCLGYFHPIVIAAVVGTTLAVGTEPAAEIERRFVDLVLARPLARATIVTRSVVVLVVGIAVVVGLMLLGTWLGLQWFTPPGAAAPSGPLLRALVVNLLALSLCWGGITLAIAVRSRRRSAAGAIAGLLAFATYLLDYIARLWAPARRIAWLSPFHYYDPMQLLLGTALPAAHVWTLVGIGSAGIAIAYVVFSRRDV
jgi:ABC-2 type transport system permease protein